MAAGRQSTDGLRRQACNGGSGSPDPSGRRGDISATKARRHEGDEEDIDFVASDVATTETTMKKTHQIAVIAGDGIGREVIPAGIAVLRAVTDGSGVDLAFRELPWGCEYYRAHGRMMDAEGFEQLEKVDAIYLGAIGAPGV